MHDASLSGIIVCVAGEPSLRERLGVELKQKPIRLIEAETDLHLFRIIRDHQLDCIILDSQLCLEGGLTVQAHMRQVLTDAPPVIFIGSTTDDRHRVAKAFRVGASDYIDGDDLNCDELLRSIRFAINRRREENDRKAELETLVKRSDFDELTGLYSRRAVEEMGKRLLAAQSSQAFMLLLAQNGQSDFCGKMVGPSFGKQLMRAFAERLRNATRQNDVIGRFDDNTIIALLPITPAYTPKSLVERLERSLQFEFHSDEISLNVSAILGTAIYPEHGIDFSDLLGSALTAVQAQVGIEPEAGPAVTNTDRRAVGARVGNRRIFTRHRVLKSGKIVMPDARSVMDCTIRDISEGGVRLRLPGILGIPNRFDLMIVGEAAARPVRRVWQSGIDVGVMFEGREASEARQDSRQTGQMDETRTALVRALTALPQKVRQLDWMSAALRAIRTRLGMEVAFVCEFMETDRVILCVDSSHASSPINIGDRIPLAVGYCKKIVDGELPELIPNTANEPEVMAMSITHSLAIGAHIGVPLRLTGGKFFGTLCCFGTQPNANLGELELNATRTFAEFFGYTLSSGSTRAELEIESTNSAVRLFPHVQ